MHAHSDVELHISCQGLRNMDVLSKSDPLVVVSLADPAGAWREIGRTEQIRDCLDPVFQRPVPIRYVFEVRQPLRFDVYDIDTASQSLADQDYLGRYETTLGQLVVERGGVVSADLRARGRTAGKITVRVVERATGPIDDVEFAFEARGLDKKDLFGKSDPYFVIKDGDVPLFKSETILKTLDPVWKPQRLPLAALGADRNKRLKVEVWDWDRIGDDDFIGECFLTLADICQPDSSKTFDLINPELAAKKKAKYKNSGQLVVRSAAIVRRPSFLDYLRSGAEINLVVAIDFTGSNGDPTDPRSLHYIGGGAPTPYAQAIAAVGNVLAPYDFDGNIAVYGYGGKFFGRDVSHCYPLNNVPANPEVPGVQGVLDVYHHALSNVVLWGPTVFTPVIEQAGEIAKASNTDPNRQKYIILLIITDGVIDDTRFAINEIVSLANTQPISIVIVGVGNADFSTMEMLDGDDVRLKAENGKVAERDIVQFVPFNRFAANPAMLAEETLKEIPDQFVQFMQKHGRMPVQIFGDRS